MLCGSSSFYHETERSCVFCPSSCSSCKNPFECVDCKPGFGKNADPSVPKLCGRCALGQYLSVDECKPCLSNCEYCNNPFTCSTCKDPFKLSAVGQCVHSCGAYSFYDESERRCEPCPSNCLKCDGGGVCQSCAAGMKITERGECEKCPAG